ncbi:MAG TPA: biliverdin-producing heme oxygenase, partial [Acetobacteraceae bacterium]|nr:biliverdin-producing heme oxygenase [Acetobacteraceae bacterium]
MTHRRGGLTAALRAGTSRLHREAERSGVIAELLAGRAGLADYLALLGNLLPVYETMEAPDAPHQVRCLVPPALFRAAAIRTDLAAGRTVPVALSPEGAAYAASVAASGKRMVAHAY